ncbi:MAG: hypothetical protein IKG47_10595 [Oscillospiraceae bacterium]|nr:hypothetical protein [Oscillospiraceae bacterium]
MASDYFDSSIEFPELDLLTGLPVGTKPSSVLPDNSDVRNDDWQKQFLNDSAKALDSGTFVNPMDIATQEENKKLRKQLEDLRAESERAQAEFHDQQDKYVEVLRQINEKNQADLEEQRVQHEKQMAELSSHFEALQTASRNAGEKESEMRAQLEQIKEEKDLAQKQAEELKRELDNQYKLAEEERRKASEEKERILAEAKENSDKVAGESSAREQELRDAFELEKTGLLSELENIKAKASEDAEAQRSYYEDRIREEVALKEAEMAARLSEADEDKKRILEKADQDQAVLKERAADRINEIIAENQKLQNEGAALALSLEESNKNYEALAAELTETRNKLEYSESEQAKREIELARIRLAEEASNRDQKINEAKQIIQKQWNKIQDDRALLEAEKEVLSKERADAEEEKRRAVSWQQSTLTERIKLQDAQKKLASDQAEIDMLRSDLDNLRSSFDEEKSRFNEEREAYEKQVAEETAVRQRQIAAARAFLEQQRKESEEERANIMMERLSFEKQRDDSNKLLQSQREEFENKKRLFFEELSKLVNWEGFRTETNEENSGENTESLSAVPEVAEKLAVEEVHAPVIDDVPVEEPDFNNDFFQNDPVESVFDDEQLPSQDRIVVESSEEDDKSVMASPFADLFNEPSLSESLFINTPIVDSSNQDELFLSQLDPEDLDVQDVPAEKKDDLLDVQNEEFSSESNSENKEETSDSEVSHINDEGDNETRDITTSVNNETAVETMHEEDLLPDSEHAEDLVVPAEPDITDVMADDADRTIEVSDSIGEKTVVEGQTDLPEKTDVEDLTSTLAFEIEQKVSELMDTVAQSEVKEPVLKEHTRENLFDTLAEVGLEEDIKLMDTGETDIGFKLSSVETESDDESPEEEQSLQYMPVLEADKNESSVADEEPFDFDAVTDALNVAMLEKEDFSFTENNLLSDGESFLIAEGVTSKYYVNTSSYSYPAFREVNFICPVGSCTAVVSDVPFCSYALLRAVASPDELAEGQVYIGGHKISNSDFLYIGSDRLLTRHSSVLEWLVDNAGGKARESESYYNKLLSEIGISKWAKFSVGSMAYSRRILILLLSSAIHQTDMIIVNDPHFKVDPKDEMIARRIFKHLHDSGKTVLIASPDLQTVQSVSSRVVLLKNSSLVYSGTYKQFMEQYSVASVSFPKEYADSVKAVIGEDHRFFIKESDDECAIELKRGFFGSTVDAANLAEKAGVPTEQIRNTEKTFAIACGEALNI